MANKTVLITGSSKGLGKSIAILFAKKKYNIILHGRDKEGLDIVKKRVLENNVSCDIVRGDITTEKTINKLFETARKRNIDILINNAGIYLNKSLGNMTPVEFRRVVEVNLIAPVLLSKRIYPIFQKKRSGLIININSIAGKKGSDGESAYAASKHGLRGFTKSFQFEANKDNVRVLELCIGTMNTAMTEGRRDPEKCIQTDEVADLIYRLCMDYPSMKINEIDISRRIY
jgi:3-oxoacyl-[acyl-carrier protein] reductase